MNAKKTSDENSELRIVAQALVYLEVLREHPQAVADNFIETGDLPGGLDSRVMLRGVLERHGMRNKSLLERMIRCLPFHEAVSWDDTNCVASLRFNRRETNWWRIHQLIEFPFDTVEIQDIAERLLAASLDLRFEATAIIRNEQCGELRRWGEYSVNGATFIVSAAPPWRLFNEYLPMRDSAGESYVLVPDRLVDSTRNFIDDEAHVSVAVQSIESFLSLFLDSRAEFQSLRNRKVFGQVIDAFNQQEGFLGVRRVQVRIVGD